ncbi:MAG: proline dehydrogenase family protein [bacterium]|jgi:proline dehydrogenase
MFRGTLLYLSEQKRLRRFTETSRLARRLTSRFVAGSTLAEAMGVCEQLKRSGILSTLDRLGESVTSLEEAEAARDGYLEALSEIAARRLPATVSIKLTQFGLRLSEERCHENALALARAAAAANNRVEIDMESSDLVDSTLAIVTSLHAACGNVRAVIQAYLRRSERDIDDLCGRRIPVRLCKGAYKEPAAVAFARKSEVDASYIRLMRALFDRGVCPAIATHDERIIDAAKQYARDRGILPSEFEFQMLYGIRRDLERLLAQQRWTLRLYVPYGEAWYPYFMRRLAERPANLFFLMRNLVKG